MATDKQLAPVSFDPTYSDMCAVLWRGSPDDDRPTLPLEPPCPGTFTIEEIEEYSARFRPYDWEQEIYEKRYKTAIIGTLLGGLTIMCIQIAETIDRGQLSPNAIQLLSAAGMAGWAGSATSGFAMIYYAVQSWNRDVYKDVLPESEYADTEDSI